MASFPLIQNWNFALLWAMKHGLLPHWGWSLENPVWFHTWLFASSQGSVWHCKLCFHSCNDAIQCSGKRFVSAMCHLEVPCYDMDNLLQILCKPCDESLFRRGQTKESAFHFFQYWYFHANSDSSFLLEQQRLENEVCCRKAQALQNAFTLGTVRKKVKTAWGSCSISLLLKKEKQPITKDLCGDCWPT